MSLAESARFMKLPQFKSHSRRGVAAMEMAVALPLVAILIFGIWDVGRMVEVQQLVCNAARDGARLAAVGSMLDSTTGAVKNIHASDVQKAVVSYLNQNGINTAGISVQFTDLSSPGVTDPYLASSMDHLRVSVQLPFNNVGMILVNNFTNTHAKTLASSADWYSMMDVSVTVPSGIPTN
jgi:Flp pilus assembly protein TadG